MVDRWAYFITWATYGARLPGDARGWRKRGCGNQLARPRLEQWCRDQMRFAPVNSSEQDRRTVEVACKEHCNVRGWNFLAINPRTNQVHIVVVADASPKVVRDQLKANCTRHLRIQESPLFVEQTWAKGADIDILDTDEDIFDCVTYVMEAQ